MKLKFIGAFILALYLLSFQFSFSQQINIPEIVVKQYVLPNGLTVILNEDHTKPQIFGEIVVKAGSKNDPTDATGLAHYQEHMLFKGTEELGTTNWTLEKPHIQRIFALYDELGKTTVDSSRKRIQNQINEESVKANEFAIPNELDKVIKMMGGTNLNANTSYDRTVYFNAFPSGQLEKWLELYSHRFISPVFRSFQAELEVVYEEKNLYSDMFQMNLLESFQSKIFMNHPYGRPIIGTIDHLKNPSLNKMYDFFKTYYVPNNMALILSGDFKIEEVIPLIESKFGKWVSRPIPQMTEFKEDTFKGRVFYEAKLSPIKLALLGYMTVPNGHPDEIALNICHKILSNQNQTGLLDKLSLDNKLLAAVMISMQMNDYGVGIMLIIPKFIGQSLDNAEKIVLEQLEKVKKGDFEDWMIESIKNEMYKNFELEMESIEGKTTSFAEIFANKKDINDYLKYPEKLKTITREDIIRVANKYYGQNYIAFYSKMGSMKKEKIQKPGFKPVISNLNAQSEFTNRLNEIPFKTPSIVFVDFKNDITAFDLPDNVKLYYTTNPKNDIFEMTVRYGIGNLRSPQLKYAAQMMDLAGADSLDVKMVKEEFSKIGCTVSIYSDDSYLSVNLEGIESNLEQALKMLNRVISNPVLEQSKLKILIDGEKTARKMESSEPDNVADALFDFVKYKNKSAYIDRLSMKELNKLKATDLVKTFKDATLFQAEIHYIGTLNVLETATLISNNLKFSKNPIISESPVMQEVEKYSENTVFLTDKKKAIQSKIYLLANGDPYDITREPYIEAFNMYFSGDFSGLVLQEIREYRSLAYGAGARYTIPPLANKNSIFYGYVGTQADKTLEALQVFDTLIHFMPQKPERMDMIKEYLIQSSLASKPDFRNLSMTIINWKNRGYSEDPLKSKLTVYKNMEFRDITKFYIDNIKPKPLVIAIVGNTKQIDLKGLEKYGKIIVVKEKDLFRK